MSVTISRRTLDRSHANVESLANVIKTYVGWTDGWVHTWMKGWMDGWTDR